MTDGPSSRPRAVTDPVEGDGDDVAVSRPAAAAVPKAASNGEPSTYAGRPVTFDGRGADATRAYDAARPAPLATGAPGAAVPPATVTHVAVPASRGPRRTKLAIGSVDPWSVFRFTLVFSVTILIVWMVVTAVLFQLLKGMGVLDSLTQMINTAFISSTGDKTVDQLFQFKKIMEWSGGLGVINAILFTALGTLGAFVYNLCARVVGGIEVTLTDR